MAADSKVRVVAAQAEIKVVRAVAATRARVDNLVVLIRADSKTQATSLTWIRTVADKKVLIRDAVARAVANLVARAEANQDAADAVVKAKVKVVANKVCSQMTSY